MHNLTPRIRFDRIDLGHTLAGAVEMRDALKSWVPLLAEGDTAAVLGVFPDWANTQKNGRAVDADEAVVAPIIEKLIKLCRVTTCFLSPLGVIHATLHDSCPQGRRWPMRGKWKPQRRHWTQHTTTRNPLPSI